jgi:uncharacterized protein YhaN
VRIESVRAVAFGPLREGRLDLAPGMTVVVGDNESAKTSWHAAIYAGLCGIGRRQGRDPRPVADFVSRHRPWDNPERWEVVAVVVLDDGRRIELRQDLASRTNCKAMDLAVGREVSDILHEQVPDAAMWLGLDRQSFPATAFVRQTDLLGVLENPEALQTHLQRAASTSGVRGTAAEALDLLEDFMAQKVGGTDLRSRSRPLMQATQAVERARTALVDAQEAHIDYLEAVAELDRLKAAAGTASEEVRLREAALASKRANDLSYAVAEAERLTAKFPAGEPAGAQADQMIGEVAAALEAWDGCELPAPLEGPSAEELRQTLAKLPPVPEGDTAVHSSVEELDRALQAAAFALDEELRAEPAPLPIEHPDLDSGELLDLAHRLSALPGGSLADVEASIGEADADVARKREQDRKATFGAVVAAVVVVVGLLGGLAGPRALLGLAVLGVAGLVFALVTRRRTGLAAATARRQELEGQRQALRAAAAQAEATRRTAAKRCGALGVAADPVELRKLAEQLRRWDTYGTSRRQWQERVDRRQRAVREAEANLRTALRSRGVDSGTDLASALADYRRDCAERSVQAERAGQRGALENQLAARERADRLVNDQLAKNSNAAMRVCNLARDLGGGELDAPAAVEVLTSWLEGQQAARREADQRIRMWARLQHLLGGRSLDELRQEADREATSAAQAATGLDSARIQALAFEADPGAGLDDLRRAAAVAADAAGRATEALRLRAVPSVPEAEEALARAQDEFDRVQRLGTTLTHTIDFLRAADERVGRQLAPVIAASVTEWLPRVTGGRYVEALVTPESMEVKVRGRGGAWREARLLSQGTAEQVFLLLRAALIKYLTDGKDRCPLILDDVTVQADATRTVAILELLHGLSAEQQVILFAQEPAVANWASTALREPDDRLVELQVVSHT